MELETIKEMIVWACLGSVGVGFSLGYVLGWHQGFHTEDKK